MSAEMFEEIAVLVLVNIGAVGGLLWVFLQFGLSRKLAQMKSDHEAALKIQHLEHETNAKRQQANHEALLKSIQAQIDVSMDEVSHARKTVFTRYDEKRAEAILKIEGALQAYTWAAVNMTMLPLDEKSPASRYVAKAFELNALSNDAMRVVGEYSFFYSKEFRTKLAVVWYPRARALAIKCVKVGTEIADDQAFKEAARGEQIDMLRQAHVAETDKLSNEVALARSELSEQLEQWFKDSTTLAK